MRHNLEALSVGSPSRFRTGVPSTGQLEVSEVSVLAHTVTESLKKASM